MQWVYTVQCTFSVSAVGHCTWTACTLKNFFLNHPVGHWATELFSFSCVHTSHCRHTVLFCSGSTVPTTLHCTPTALWAGYWLQSCKLERTSLPKKEKNENMEKTNQLEKNSSLQFIDRFPSLCKTGLSVLDFLIWKHSCWPNQAQELLLHFLGSKSPERNLLNRGRIFDGILQFYIIPMTASSLQCFITL